MSLTLVNKNTDQRYCIRGENQRFTVFCLALGFNAFLFIQNGSGCQECYSLLSSTFTHSFSCLNSFLFLSTNVVFRKTTGGVAGHC